MDHTFFFNNSALVPLMVTDDNSTLAWSQAALPDVASKQFATPHQASRHSTFF